ncbi:MAG: FGGY-family carbohydrate kinase, partial [Candidatus Limnocylindrales bacterium]
MSADRILAIDVGTQSVRAMVFDATGVLQALAKVPIEPYLPGPPGVCEQDADLYWRAIGEACRQLWVLPGARRDALAGVALTTQRGTVVVTDDAGDPLRPAIVWLDRRRAEGLPRIGGRWGLAFRAARVTGTVATFMAEAEANVLARGEPELWARVRHYLLLSGFLSHRLTGRFVDSVASQVGYLPFDYRKLAWAKPGDWRWQAVPIRPEWLPELVPPTAQLGSISAVAAEATGIPAGLPLVAAAGDKACEVLGSGALEPHIGAISLGTTASINTTHRRYVEVIPIVPPYPAAVPGAYSLEVQVYRGYWMIEWFKREFGAQEVARAETLGVEPETLFDELLASTPAGSMGLVLQPYWSPGVRIPGPEAKGAVIGWGDVH